MNAVSLGEIIIISNDSAKEYSFTRKIVYDKETFHVGVNLSDGISASEIEGIIFYVLYASAEGAEYAYAMPDELSIVFLNSSGPGSYFVYRESFEEAQEEMAIIDAVEFHFGGNSQLHIEMSPKELRQHYGENNKNKIIILGVLIAFLVVAGVYFAQEEPPPPAPVYQAPPPPPVLTEAEAISIKEIISIDAMGTLRERAGAIAADSFMRAHTKISEVQLSEAKPSQTPAGELSLSSELKIAYAYDFQAKGAELVGNNLYTKIELIQINKGTKDGSLVERELTPQCLSRILSATAIATAKKRDDKNINISLLDISPRNLIEQYGSLSSDCPVYLESLSGKEDLFTANVVLYKKVGN